MMNKIKTFLLGVMLVVCLGSGYHAFTVEQDMPRLYTKHKSSTVSLLAVEADNFFAATGFVVDIEKGYIFTAGHFARDDRMVFLIDYNNSEKSNLMRCVKVNLQKECAIFQIDPLLLKNLGCKEVKFSTDVSIGDTIFIIGDPYQNERTLTVGILSRKETVVFPLFSIDVFMTDALIIGGSSGSPVFNLKGEVIGCAVGHYNGFGLILPAQTIINFVNSLN